MVRTLINDTNTREGYLPLHVTAFSAPKREDPALSEHIETQRIDAFLVDDDEVFALFLAVDGLVADQLLEFDDLFYFGIGEPAFGLDELFALLGGGIEKS